MKHFFLLLATFFICGVSYCQQVKWAKSEALPGYITWENYVAHDNHGNTIIAGQCNQNSIYIIKYDNNGNKHWQHIYPGSNWVRSVITDTVGNSYVLIAANSLTINNAVYSSGRFLIIKYDLNGNISWIKSTDEKIGINSISSDRENGFYASGSFKDTIALDNNVILQDTTGNGKYFLAYFNYDGDCQWALSGEGSLDSKISSANKNSFFTSGYFTNTVTVGQSQNQVTLYSQNGYNYQAKYSSTGTLLWVKQLNTSLIAPDFVGNFFTFERDTNFLQLYKYNPAGLLLWKKAKVQSSLYRAQMTVNKRGDIFLSGGFANQMIIDDSISIHGNGTYLEACVIKFDSAGNFKWIVTNLGSGGATTKAISADDTDNIYITGDMERQVKFGNIPLDEPDGGIFTLKIKDLDTVAVVSLPPTSTMQNKLKVFPIPTGGIINIRLTEGIPSTHSHGQAAVKIKNVLGETVHSKNIFLNNEELYYSIDLSHQPKEVYLLEFNAQSIREVRKIVLE